MGKLIFIRHGETEKNLNDNLHAVNDPEILNAIGRDQMKKTAIEVKTLLSSKIYTSKEQRAIESAQILSGELGIPIEKIEGVQERNWGVFTGKPWNEVKTVLDPLSLDERYEYIPPEGESWRVFESRLVAAIKKIVKHNKDKTIIVVTHGGAIRALMPYLLGVSREESFKYDPDNASLTVFDFENGKFTKILVNNTSHLS